MSRFHASVRDVLEDTYSFLNIDLQNEILSSSSLAHRDKLLYRLLCLQKDYPELQLSFVSKPETEENTWDKSDSSGCTPSSPVPYVDMNGGSPYKILPFSQNASFEDASYDLCSAKAKSENQSLTESEDYLSDDAKNLPYVAASDLATCDKAGFLDKKKRESIKGWLNPFQRRWCAIKDGVLYYYEKTSDRKQRGSIILAGYEARPLSEDNNDGKKYSHCFELVCPGKRTYQFSASSEKDMQQWIVAVENNCKIAFSGKPVNKNSNESSKETNLVCNAEDIYETVLEEEDKPTALNEKSQDSLDSEDYSDVTSTENQVFNYSEWYVGLWDCLGEDDSELSFARGDLIHIISKEYDAFAWWIGELEGKVGFVPRSYLMEAYEAY